jgi:prepilin-type N-terminal cleavage/methylation domain-containing protein
MNRRGFSLIEMLVVIAIAGILLAVALPQFGLIIRRRSQEREIREIQSAISSFRLSAIHRKEQHRVVLGPNLVHFQWLNPTTNAWEPTLGAQPAAGTAVPPAMILTYQIQKLPSGVLTPFSAPANPPIDYIQFSERGYADDFHLATIVVTPVDMAIGDGCIIVDRARNNVGRMSNANTCQAR